MRKLLRNILGLELEEQFLNAGSVLALFGVFFPWISGEWLGGDTIVYSGFGFYTSFLGYCIALLHVWILSITIVPLSGGPILLRKRHRECIRFAAAFEAVILVLVALSVLTSVTFEFSRMEVRFGVYTSLIGSLVTLLYAFLRFQEFRRTQAQEVFHHPEDQMAPSERKENVGPPPPPPVPPPPPEPEEHRLFS